MQKLLSDLAAKRSSFEDAFARSEGELHIPKDTVTDLFARRGEICAPTSS